MIDRLSRLIPHIACWRMDVQYQDKEDDADEDSITPFADFKQTGQYHVGRITLYEPYLFLPPIDRMETMLHELVHTFTAPAHDICTQVIAKATNQRIAEICDVVMYEALELLTDNIARMLAAMLIDQDTPHGE